MLSFADNYFVPCGYIVQNIQKATIFIKFKCKYKYKQLDAKRGITKLII